MHLFLSFAKYPEATIGIIVELNCITKFLHGKKNSISYVKIWAKLENQNICNTDERKSTKIEPGVCYFWYFFLVIPLFFMVALWRVQVYFAIMYTLIFLKMTCSYKKNICFFLLSNLVTVSSTLVKMKIE